MKITSFKPKHCACNLCIYDMYIYNMYIFIKLVLAAFINFYQFIYLFFLGLISPFLCDKDNNKDLIFI